MAYRELAREVFRGPVGSGGEPVGTEMLEDDVNGSEPGFEEDQT